MIQQSVGGGYIRLSSERGSSSVTAPPYALLAQPHHSFALTELPGLTSVAAAAARTVVLRSLTFVTTTDTGCQPCLSRRTAPSTVATEAEVAN